MKQVLKFLIPTFIITWIIWGIALMINKEIIHIKISDQIFVILGTFIPSIIGTLFLLKQEKQSFKQILKSTFIYQKRYILYLLIMPFILGVSYLLLVTIFHISFDLEVLRKPYLIVIVLIYILFLGGPLGEEIGWRGYLLPLLLKKTTPFFSSLIIGVIWSIWHLPLFYIIGTIQSQLPFIAYIFYTMILTFYITLVYIKTDGSISSGVYVHLSANLSIGVFTIINETISFYFIGGFMIVTLGYILLKYRNIFFKHYKPEVSQ